MTVPGGERLDDRIVVGYFSDGADALRAIDELIDEGFRPSEIGAAFRTHPAGPSAAASIGSTAARTSRTDDLTPAGDRNPAETGSVGGPASHDEAVQPAGLAPGSGNAFPAPSRPGPIPGSELPSTLRHELPRTLPTEQELAARRAETAPPGLREERGMGNSWAPRLQHVWSGSERTDDASRRRADNSAMKFGTGEGHLDLSSVRDYSESSFESSFLSMGLGPEEARRVSEELSRGGAVVSVTADGRDVLAEGIIARNHGRVRFETASPLSTPVSDDRNVEVFGRIRGHYPQKDYLRSRRAS